MSFDELITKLNQYTKLGIVSNSTKFDAPFGITEAEKHAWCTGKLAGRLELANEIRTLLRQIVEENLNV